jgi:hypothetical protein
LFFSLGIQRLKIAAAAKKQTVKILFFKNAPVFFNAFPAAVLPVENTVLKSHFPSLP